MTPRGRIASCTRLYWPKPQDSLGEKVFPGVLALTLDPLPPEAPFAEKLQRLQRLGVLGSVETWRLLREVRSALAHDYPENPALQAAALSAAKTHGAGSRRNDHEPRKIVLVWRWVPGKNSKIRYGGVRANQEVGQGDLLQPTSASV